MLKAKPKKPLVVHVSIWTPQQPLSFVHNDKVHQIAKLAQARTFAADNGYSGIRCTVDPAELGLLPAKGRR